MRKISVVLLGSAFLASAMLPSFAQQGGPPGAPGPGLQRGGQGPRGFGGGGPRGFRNGGPELLRPRGPGMRGAGMDGRRFGGFQGGGPRFRDGGYRHRGGYGAAIGAGVAGLAAGAVIGGALSSQPYYGGGYTTDDGEGPYGPYGGGPAAVAGDVADEAPAGGDDVAYCQQRYRSYDVASATYLGYDGLRHPCP